jgi:hypothetical protein
MGNANQNLPEAVKARLTEAVRRAEMAAQALADQLGRLGGLATGLRIPSRPWARGGVAVWIVDGYRWPPGARSVPENWGVSISPNSSTYRIRRAPSSEARHSDGVVDEWTRYVWRSPREQAGWLWAWAQAEAWCRERIAGLERACREIERQQARWARAVKGETSMGRLAEMED